MEENHWELNSYFSFLSSDPLFSIIITIYTLILLYFPYIFLRILLSPVLISTGILLLILLRLGAIQRIENNKRFTEHLESESTIDYNKCVESKTEIEDEIELGFHSDKFLIGSFVEWNVGAPLEVIHEAYEGDEDHEQNRYPSLANYYPESDTESSSDGDFTYAGEWELPEKRCFRWDEDDREELIEIDLDDDGRRNSDFDEDNMIEIDVSPATKL